MCNFLNKKLEWKNFYQKKKLSEKNLLGKKFCKKKIFWGKILLEKYLSQKKTCWEKILSEKKLLENFLSESCGCDEHDLICIFVYQMSRLCRGAHEISNIKAPIFLCGWVVWLVGWVVSW